MASTLSVLYGEITATIVGPGMEIYKYLMETKSDPRTQSWPLIRSPTPLLITLAVYLYFCVWFGPRIMRERKALNLKHIIRLYDILQIGLNTYTVYGFIRGGWGTDYSFTCQPVDYSDSPKAVQMASSVWWYFMGNVIALLDTIFFILRKKNNQVSFLHLYHHSMMPLCSWIGAKFVPGGHGTLLGLINSFIHILMYLYYFITSLGPSFQKYVKWKRHLTELQMIQFFILFLHSSQALFHQCDYPKTMNFILLTQEAFLVYQLGRFYVWSYITPRNLAPSNINIPNGKISSQ